MRGLVSHCQFNAVLLVQRPNESAAQGEGDYQHSDAVNSPGEASGETVVEQRLTELEAIV